MKEIIAFLNELKLNNNKVWFDANRARYEEINEKFKIFAEKLIAGVGSFDSSVSGVQVKDCTYRIYKDVRFSKDKTPYKTHMGVYIAQGGKKSGYAGYYFHVEANGGSFLSHHLLACGLHCGLPKEILSVKQEIVDNYAQFTKSVQTAKGFYVDKSTIVSRVPKGFDKNFEGQEYLRLKDFLLQKDLTDDVVFEDNLVEYLVGEFKKAKPFVTILNKAIQYAKEEM